MNCSSCGVGLTNNEINEGLCFPCSQKLLTKKRPEQIQHIPKYGYRETCVKCGCALSEKETSLGICYPCSKKDSPSDSTNIHPRDTTYSTTTHKCRKCGIELEGNEDICENCAVPLPENINDCIRLIICQNIDTLFHKMEQVISEEGDLEEMFFPDVESLLLNNEMLANFQQGDSWDNHKDEALNLVFSMITDYKFELSKTKLAKTIGSRLYADLIQSITNKHISTLATKWEQTVHADDYGNYVFDRWFRELDYFVDNVLRKNEKINDCLASLQNQQQTREFVMGAIAHFRKSRIGTSLLVDVDSLAPLQFELYCADELRTNGWDARVTQASGDQGVDVVAIRGDVKAVFQCKKYAQPVGNGAVQEIIAGKQFERADIAVVVSNTTYTPSARQLAATTGVFLLHYSELSSFAERLGLD